MKLIRMFSNDSVKGTENYLKTQKKYELLRTILYFGISLSLLIAGWVTTKSRANLLTIVAILGCLPASKSLVSTIMYFRYHGLNSHEYTELSKHVKNTYTLCDCVFTSYEKNYEAPHIAVKNNTVSVCAPKIKNVETDFSRHLSNILKADGLTNVSIKVYSEWDKYLIRLDQLGAMDEESEETTNRIAETLKSVSL